LLLIGEMNRFFLHNIIPVIPVKYQSSQFLLVVSLRFLWVIKERRGTMAKSKSTTEKTFAGPIERLTTGKEMVYKTTISDSSGDKVTGRGSTPEIAQKIASDKWDAHKK